MLWDMAGEEDGAPVKLNHVTDDTSAKSGQHVEEAFPALSRRILHAPADEDEDD